MISPYNNHVLIRPVSDKTSTNVDSLSIDPSYTPHEHTLMMGSVVATPKRLVFNRDDTSTMPWLTEMDIEVGDRVIYHYLSAMTADDKHMSKTIKIDGHVHYFIPYNRIFIARRKKEIICLNGFILVEPMQKQDLLKYKKYLSIGNIKDAFFGRVSHIGSLIKDYGAVYDGLHSPDENWIKEGMVIIMDNNCGIPLQYEFHADLEGNKMFYRVQRRYILGVLGV